MIDSFQQIIMFLLVLVFLKISLSFFIGAENNFFES